MVEHTVESIIHVYTLMTLERECNPAVLLMAKSALTTKQQFLGLMMFYHRENL